MNANVIFSIAVIMSGIYAFLCFLAVTGKRLLPNLYAEEANMAQRYLVLFSGLIAVALGTYSIFVKPLFL